MKTLIGIPVHNEEEALEITLKKIIRTSYPSKYNVEFLIFDDGSKDDSSSIYNRIKRDSKRKIHIRKHSEQKGYGTTITDILKFAFYNKYDFVATIDADLQHEPFSIIEALKLMEKDSSIDIVSTSRYLSTKYMGEAEFVPYDRYLINMILSWLINNIFALKDSRNMNPITDAFCGLKIYKTKSLDSILSIKTFDYSYPLEAFFKIYENNLKLIEIPTPLIYLEERRSRGDWPRRLSNYLCSLDGILKNNNQKDFFNMSRTMLWEFLECKLIVHPVNEEFFPYNQFWKNHTDPQSSLTCEKCTNVDLLIGNRSSSV